MTMLSVMYDPVIGACLKSIAASPGFWARQLKLESLLHTYYV